ncbi:Dockerin type I repeat protein [Rubripirellula obstinata]|uniref:Dockerin type I repeat protein n=1 Tax=Rubripirellula obstinata TaxID=406547 RepID=A0A5B1CIA5_9BACT|nr:choice-of-anchor Q domain-containing protein [Rubripirellula obstinata]KAA1260296.1 Dockerin type I repeat protein [Rubripirellula obstinata]
MRSYHRRQKTVRNRRRLRCESLESRRLLAASLGFDSVGFDTDSSLAEGEDQTFVVTTLDDELDQNPGDDLSDLSLREAISLANQLAGRDTISFANGLTGTIEFEVGLGQLLIDDPVDLIGPGADAITLNAMNNSRVIQLSANAGDVRIEGLTLTGGRTTADLAGGAGIRSLSTGMLTIDGVVITGNNTFGQGAAGAGVISGFSIADRDNPGSLTVIDSVISNNQTGSLFAGGGGVFSGGGTLTISGSTVSGNQTQGESAIGGGIYTTNTVVTITDSTISGNSTRGINSSGGGLAIQNSTLDIQSSTISGNTTAEQDSLGGGIFARRTDVTLINSTISGNTATIENGGGLYASRGTVDINHSTITGNQSGGNGGGVAVPETASQVVLTAVHSIIAANTDTAGTAPDLLVGDSLDTAGSVTFSLIGNNAGTGLTESQSVDPSSGNLVGDSSGSGLIDPLLGDLADNGGPTLTHSLLGGSPAIDAGDTNFPNPPTEPSETTDQRGDGFPRVINDRIDIGSFEFSTIVSTPTLDFGDASGDYAVLASDDGARHVVSSLFLGNQVDAEVDGQVSATADGDGSDDDGLIAISDFVTSASSSTTAAYLVTASEAGRLDGWIDFNQDGDWLDAGEQIFASVDVTAGSNTLPFSIPAGANSGTTFARFRISTAGGLSPLGQADDGEVEDYQVTLLDGSATPNVGIQFSGDQTSVATESGEAVVRIGTVEVFRAPLTATGTLTLTGAEEDTTLTVNVVDGIDLPNGGLSIVGGAGSNTLSVVGDGGAIDFTSANINVTGFGTLDLSNPDLNTVTIDAPTIQAWSPATARLSILLGETTPASDGSTDFDTLIVSDAEDWLMADPVTVDGQFRLTAETIDGGGETIEVSKPAVWQNVLQINDVNNNGTVTALDALQIINELARGTFSDPDTGILLDPLTISDFPGRYFDQNGDGRITALDALRVINELARQADNSATDSEFEGELVSGLTEAQQLPVRNEVSESQQDDDAEATDVALNQLF